MRQALAVSGATERKREGIEHKLDRLRGWSRNRIERWLVQVEADRDRHANASYDDVRAQYGGTGSRLRRYSRWCRRRRS